MPHRVHAGVALLGPEGLFTAHRDAILVGLTITAGLIVAAVAARWFSRMVGWRRMASAIAGYVAGGVRDIASFAWAPVRYRRRVRFASRTLLDPELPAVCGAALATVRAALADQPGRWPYLLLVGREITVGIAGRASTGGPNSSARGATNAAGTRATPSPVAAPNAANRAPGEEEATGRWATAAGPQGGRAARGGPAAPGPRPVTPPPWRLADPGRWTAARSDILAATAPRRPGADPDSCLVAVGVSASSAGDALVLLDLAGLPAVGVVEGPQELCRRVTAAIAAQLAAGLSPAGRRTRLVVTDDVLPGHGGPALADALDELAVPTPQEDPTVSGGPDAPSGHGADHDAGAGDVRTCPDLTVLVCVRPAEEQAARLAALVARDSRLRALVIGDWAGARWRLVVDHLAHLEMPELGIDCDAAPIEHAVSRALRRGSPRAARPDPLDREPVPNPADRLPHGPEPTPDPDEVLTTISAPPPPSPPAPPPPSPMACPPPFPPVPASQPTPVPPASARPGWTPAVVAGDDARADEPRTGPAPAPAGLDDSDLAGPGPDEVHTRIPTTAASAVVPSVDTRP
ncbi:hypothetical protein [Pseudofrankia asymbiotica]|nr:hypothetical protein [Pseudofrankia asymbiotica]